MKRDSPKTELISYENQGALGGNKMGVERVDYSSDEEYNQALQTQEAEYWSAFEKEAKLQQELKALEEKETNINTEFKKALEGKSSKIDLRKVPEEELSVERALEKKGFKCGFATGFSEKEFLDFINKNGDDLRQAMNHSSCGYKRISEILATQIENSISEMLHAHRDCLRNKKINTTKMKFDCRDGYYGEAFGIMRALKLLNYGYFGSVNLTAVEEKKGKDPRNNLRWWFKQIEEKVLEEEGYKNGTYRCPYCLERYGKDTRSLLIEEEKKDKEYKKLIEKQEKKFHEELSEESSKNMSVQEEYMKSLLKKAEDD